MAFERRRWDRGKYRIVFPRRPEKMYIRLWATIIQYYV